MNKFAIKKLRNNKQAQQEHQECSTDFLNNKDEFSNQTSEENRLYDKIHLTVSDSGSIRLNDELPKIEYLLYLLFDLRGMDPFLDYIFHDPTQEFLNRVRGNLDINDTTKEIVRKNLHYSLYHHLLTYDYRTLKSMAIDLSQQKSQRTYQAACQ
mgnify:CR=1 FL=1